MKKHPVVPYFVMTSSASPRREGRARGSPIALYDFLGSVSHQEKKKPVPKGAAQTSKASFFRWMR